VLSDDSFPSRELVAQTSRMILLAGLLLLPVATAPAGSGGPLEDAERAFSEGDFVTAYRMAGEAAKTDPENARARYLAGASGLKLKQQDVAIGEHEDTVVSVIFDFTLM